MANVNIAPAMRAGLNPQSYRPISIASLDYGEFIVNKFFECEKTDDWQSVSAKGFLRLAALDFPAYGRTSIKGAAFFVPYYQILANIDGFRQGLLHDKGAVCLVPSMRGDIVNLVCDQDGLRTVVATGDYSAIPPLQDSFDFIHISDNSGATEYRYLKLNWRGKRLYKFLKMLGYDFYYYNLDNTFTNVDQDVPYVNSLSLLAFAKIWADYFCNIHLYNTNTVVQFLRSVKDSQDFYVGGVGWYYSSTGVVTASAVYNIFLETLVPFESSLYLNAWNSEASPIGSLSNEETSFVNQSLLSPHLPKNSVASDVVTQFFDLGASLRNNNTNPLSVLTQFGINSVESFFKFVKRNHLFGSESAKTAFARFGIKGDDYNSMFARKLFETSQEIDFTAVMSNSNTVSGGNGSYLGAYAGAGVSSLDFTYNYKCSDYGIIMNLSWLQITPMQIHGFEPSVLRQKPLDWFTPEFDGKAIRAIPKMEILSPKYNISVAQRQAKSVYGYIGIYDEYRRMRDTVLGDFVVDPNVKKFFFGRDLSNFITLINVIPQSVMVQYYDRYCEYKDITDPFQFDLTNGDRFYLELNYDIKASRPMLSTADSLELNGEGEIQTTTDSNPNA